MAQPIQIESFFRSIRKCAQCAMGNELPKLPSSLVNITIIFGAFLCLREIYMLLNYSLPTDRYLPDFFRISQTHLNMAIFFLTLWLILFCHLAQKSNTRGLLILSLIYGGFLLHFWYGKSQLAWGNLYFYIPSRFPRMLFYIDSAFFCWIVLRFVWLEDDEQTPDES